MDDINDALAVYSEDDPDNLNGLVEVAGVTTANFTEEEVLKLAESLGVDLK